MLKNLVLAHKVNKFYKTFGDALDIIPCHTKAKDLKNSDFILGVKFDVLEVIEAYSTIFDEKVYPIDKFLNNLYNTLNEKGEH